MFYKHTCFLRKTHYGFQILTLHGFYSKNINGKSLAFPLMVFIMGFSKIPFKKPVMFFCKIFLCPLGSGTLTSGTLILCTLVSGTLVFSTLISGTLISTVSVNRYAFTGLFKKSMACNREVSSRKQKKRNQGHFSWYTCTRLRSWMKSKATETNIKVTLYTTDANNFSLKNLFPILQHYFASLVFIVSSDIFEGNNTRVQSAQNRTDRVLVPSDYI